MKALSGNDRLSPRAPRLQVKDLSGEWVTVIEDLGLPSGIDRTFVADLTGVFLSSDRRVRVVTNFAVYWDQAAFALPASDSGVATRALAPTTADLHYRGFSEAVREEGKPERYDYERLLPEAPWNAVSGRYTRYGDVASLASSTDGRLVVMAPGDEVTLTFDVRDLPAVGDGDERDYLLHVTGWAKDQDPNTRSSRTVDPLPGASTKDGDSLRTRRVPALVPPLPLSQAPQAQDNFSLADALTKGRPR